MTIILDQQVKKNRADFILVNKLFRQTTPIGVAIPINKNLKNKDKIIGKYRDLKPKYSDSGDRKYSGNSHIDN